MIRYSTNLLVEFTEYIPPQLEPRVLYVSLKFSTASHLCPCGCGVKVVTPLVVDGWTLQFCGEKVSLFPSIVNNASTCRSHYWIRESQFIEALYSSDIMEKGSSHTMPLAQRLSRFLWRVKRSE
jgi:hypothetical protein